MNNAINNLIKAEAKKEIHIREYWKWDGIKYIIQWQKVLKTEQLGSRIIFGVIIPELKEFDEVIINGKKYIEL